RRPARPAPGRPVRRATRRRGQVTIDRPKEDPMSRTTIDAPGGVPFIDVSREFDAPRDLVWKAWTEPELLKQWLGPAKYEMEYTEHELRDGGRWRFVHR